MRLLLRWVLNAAALFAIAYFSPQIGILEGFRLEGIEGAVVAAAVLGLLNLTVRPLLQLLALPISCLTFGLFSLVINAVVMLIAGQIVTGFQVGGFWNALVASILFAILSSIFNAIINPEKDDK
jgi:putative membrane protein